MPKGHIQRWFILVMLTSLSLTSCGTPATIAQAPTAVPTNLQWIDMSSPTTGWMFGAGQSGTPNSQVSVLWRTFDSGEKWFDSDPRTLAKLADGEAWQRAAIYGSTDAWVATGVVGHP
ncbi:MAG: hypothetical protein HKL82_02810 [Acidimicrobiaceae bacterium]|nr:hypothetical protein [Acidimicrobiaceae bacterium]